MVLNINACALFLGTFLHELLHYLKRHLNKNNDNYCFETLTLLTNSISFCMVLGNTIILRYHYSFKNTTPK